MVMTLRRTVYLLVPFSACTNQGIPKRSAPSHAYLVGELELINGESDGESCGYDHSQMNDKSDRRSQSYIQSGRWAQANVQNVDDALRMAKGVLCGDEELEAAESQSGVGNVHERGDGDDGGWEHGEEEAPRCDGDDG